MPEPVVEPTVQPTIDPQKATNAENSGNEGSQEFDTSKLTDDQLNKVLEDQRLWKTQRLQELRQKAKIADELTAAQKKREDDEAVKKGEYEKILTERDNKITELQASLQNTKIETAIERAATKLGAVDSNAVAKLIDRSTIKLNDDGNVEGVEDAVKILLDASPYLKGKPVVTNMGSPTNPTDQNQQIRTFKASQLDDTKFFKENEKEIMAAWRAGLIENDK